MTGIICAKCIIFTTFAMTSWSSVVVITQTAFQRFTLEIAAALLCVRVLQFRGKVQIWRESFRTQYEHNLIRNIF